MTNMANYTTPHTTPQHSPPHHTTPYHTTPHHTPHHTTPHPTTPHHTPHHTTPHPTTLHETKLNTTSPHDCIDEKQTLTSRCYGGTQPISTLLMTLHLLDYYCTLHTKAIYAALAGVRISLFGDGLVTLLLSIHRKGNTQS